MGQIILASFLMLVAFLAGMLSEYLFGTKKVTKKYEQCLRHLEIYADPENWEEIPYRNGPCQTDVEYSCPRVHHDKGFTARQYFRLYENKKFTHGMIKDDRVCQVCRGAGERTVYKSLCWWCNGKGRTDERYCLE